MITYTGDLIQIGSDLKVFFNSSVELRFDVIYRADDSIIARLYAFSSDSQIGIYETEYDAATVNAESTSETSYTGEFNQAVQQLEKARLEALNPTNTFTITL